MSPSGAVAARRLLFLAAVLFLPVPYWAVEVERAPVVRLLALATMTGIAALQEPGGVISIVAGSLAAQAVLWLAVLAIVARLIVGRLPEAWRGTVVAIVAGALAVLALFPIYHTPFARSSARTNILGVFG